MTRKDYVKIARVIKDNTNKKLEMCNTLNKRNVINDLCIVLKQDNNNFDKARFVDACND
jgi:hypothetical protein